MSHNDVQYLFTYRKRLSGFLKSTSPVWKSSPMRHWSINMVTVIKFKYSLDRHLTLYVIDRIKIISVTMTVWVRVSSVSVLPSVYTTKTWAGDENRTRPLFNIRKRRSQSPRLLLGEIIIIYRSVPRSYPAAVTG